MRVLIRCEHGRFDDVRLDHVARLKRGRNECALCQHRMEREIAGDTNAMDAVLSLRQALSVLLKAADLILTDEAYAAKLKPEEAEDEREAGTPA